MQTIAAKANHWSNCIVFTQNGILFIRNEYREIFLQKMHFILTNYCYYIVVLIYISLSRVYFHIDEMSKLPSNGSKIGEIVRVLIRRQHQTNWKCTPQSTFEFHFEICAHLFQTLYCFAFFFFSFIIDIYLHRNLLKGRHALLHTYCTVYNSLILTLACMWSSQNDQMTDRRWSVDVSLNSTNNTQQ